MAGLNLAAKAADMKKQMEGNNPSNLPQPPKAERKRIPMSLPQRRLDVAPIPGYQLFWILGKPDRIAQAQAAFYEFVSMDEVNVNDRRVGADLESGSTDLGSRVSVVAGDELDHSGQPIRLYLMKVRNEYAEEDAAVIEERNSQVARELSSQFNRGTVGGTAPGETGADGENRYVDARRTSIPDFFKPKPRRA